MSIRRRTGCPSAPPRRVAKTSSGWRVPSLAEVTGGSISAVHSLTVWGAGATASARARTRATGSARTASPNGARAAAAGSSPIWMSVVDSGRYSPGRHW